MSRFAIPTYKPVLEGGSVGRGEPKGLGVASAVNVAVAVLVAVLAAVKWGDAVLVAVAVKVAVPRTVLVGVNGTVVGSGVGVRVRVCVEDGVDVDDCVEVGEFSSGEFVGVGARNEVAPLSPPQPVNTLSKRQIAAALAASETSGRIFLRVMTAHRYQHTL